MKGSRAPIPVRQTERIEVRTTRPRPTRPEAARRGLFQRRGNRRVPVTRPSVAIWLMGAFAGLGRRLLVLGKAAAALLFLAGAAYGGNRAVHHVIASPRFAVRELRVDPTPHVPRDEILALTGVNPGDRLLSVDTDAVAARVATHPWVSSARVRRELPAALAIDVTERRAVAAALLGGLYLLDESGRPFKRATLEEADGLIVLTGVTREQYAGFRAASEGAFREALTVAATYRAQDALAARLSPDAGARPALSEVRIDPRYGFSLFLFDGGAEIRLGRGDYDQKLARLDEILAALGPHRSSMRLIHLDGPARDRVPVRLAAASAPAGAVSGTLAGKSGGPPIKKFRSATKRSED